jgi:surface protein
MDCVTMVLVERETGLPLDLVVFINSFLYESLTDGNFKQAIALWFENQEECKFRFGHISDWNTSRVTNMVRAFYNRSNFNEDLGQWNVRSVTNMGRYEQQEEATGATVPYRTATGGRREGAMPSQRERESSEGQDRAIRILQQRKRERREEERSRAGPQMPSLVVVVDVS